MATGRQYVPDRIYVVAIRNSLFAALATMLLVIPAWGQEVEPDTGAVYALEPIVITALRTPFLLTEVPYAVAVNEYDEIQRARPGLGLDEALFGIPGVHVDNRFNYAQGERISIRGFGARAQFGVRGVRLLLDGIPATLPDGQTALNNIDLGVLERAEVIRGPASSLYGNAAGGVIQLETETPRAVPFSQEIAITSGQNGLMRLESTTGGRTANTWYLLNVAKLSYEGYRAFNETENLYLNARMGQERATNAWNAVVSFVDYDAKNPGSLSDSLLRADRTQAYQFNQIQQTGEKGRQGQAGVRYRHLVGPGELEMSGYVLGRQIDNPIPPSIIDLARLAGGVRVLYRSHTRPGTSGLKWTAGMEVDHQRDDRQNFNNERGERGEQILDQLERVSNAALFAQLSADILPRLDLLGGLRYDYFRFSADDRLVGSENPDDSGVRPMDAFSPSLGLTYEASRALNVYANVSTSFETPTTTELANRPSGAGGFNTSLEPQQTLSFEAGARGWVSGTMAYQVAAFRAGIENVLIPFEVPDVPGRQFFRNAGSARHQGLEAGASWTPVQGLRTRLAYTYLDAFFEEYEVDGVSFDGNSIPGVAPHRFEAGISCETREGWFAALNLRRVSKMPVNDANDANSPAYTLLDLRAGLEEFQFGSMHVSAFAGINNLLDEHYNTSVVINAFGGRYYEPGPGRAFYIGAKLGFDWHAAD